MVELNFSPRANLRVVPEGALALHIRAQDEAKAAAAERAQQPVMTNLAAYIGSQFDMMRNHRDDAAAGWSQRLLDAIRAFNGQYSADKLANIRKFGGSEVYARIIAMKCRGASALLRDVYLAPDRPWGLGAPADPDVPPEVMAAIQQLVSAEAASLQQAGQPIDPGMVRDRVAMLMESAREAARKQAVKRAKIAEDKIEEILTEGGFYKALAEFIVDLPIFPFAVMKGPVVKIVPTVAWNNGVAVTMQKPRLIWQRVSPFDFWFTPGVADIEDASTIERTRLTRADLNDLLDLPGYDHNAIRAVLRDYGTAGYSVEGDSVDTERAIQENRENPRWNRSGIIECLEFQGNVQGQILLDQGMTPQQVPDALRDYMVQTWKIGRYIIKVQLSPSPRKRHPYFMTSFEKVPGTPVGASLTDILSDIQDVCNATLRALVNNLSIASGPQVVVNDDRLSPGESGEQMYPWKRWHVRQDPVSNAGAGQKPIDFFQPNSNAQELLSVYQAFNNIADEVSAIPKYLSGNGPGGGAGRTASGLAMLMGNASKLLQTVAANVDRDVFEPLLTNLFDMLMLTDATGILQGDEEIKVMGVNVAIQRETQRSRQLEFLQITANPIDAPIVGPKGRAAVLRSVAETIGLDGEEIVPSEAAIEQMQQAAAQMASAGAAAQGGQQGSQVTKDMGPRTTIAGGSG